MTENKRSEAAKVRAAEQKRLDPMFFKRRGGVGGQKSKRVMTEEEKKAFSRIGVEARKKKLNDLKGKDLHE